MSHRNLHLAVFVTVGIIGMSAAQAELVTFDDIPAGRIGDQYFSRRLRFFVGNGEYGTSTGLLMLSGQPVTANVGNYGTSVSQPNIMNPGLATGVPGNSDVIVQFYDAGGARTMANSVGIFNDTDGNPATIFIEGFDLTGTSLGRTQINGAGAGGTFVNPGIYFAKIYPAAAQAGLIGVDNFSFTLAPAPGSGVLVATALIPLIRRRRK
jgi:hypothetical protein